MLNVVHLEVDETEDVFVAQLTQQLHLADRALRLDGVVEEVGDLFDGHKLVGLRVLGAAHEAIGAVADGTQQLVLLVHSKLGASDQELHLRLSALADR